MNRNTLAAILILTLATFTVQAVEETIISAAGVVESTSGGFKFPDGSFQSSATLIGPEGPAGPTGPKGDDGDLGPEGPTGPQGPAGLLDDGVAVGDMAYWDGSAWSLIPAPVTGPTTLSFCEGVPTWTATPCYAIGDTGPAGGIVFYLEPDSGGLHGFEAEAEDLPGTYEYGCFNIQIGVESSMPTTIGSGVTNTAQIVDAMCLPLTPDNLIAADAVVAHGLGWFLPSKDELDLLYQQKDVVGGFVNDLYWSSSEWGAGHASFQIFGGGAQGVNGKNNLQRVRAVRAF